MKRKHQTTITDATSTDTATATDQPTTNPTTTDDTADQAAAMAAGQTSSGKWKATKKAKAPKAPKAPRPILDCACGCGSPCVTNRAQFISGHDGRLKGWLLRVIDEDLTTDDLPMIELGRLMAIPFLQETRFMAIMEQRVIQIKEEAAA